MKPKQKFKLTVDLAMTALLLLLMAYELIGQAAHEWLGIGIFVLFILHHFLNGKWLRSIFKCRYTPLRFFQTVLNVLILASMAGSMVSGVILSRHALAFLPIKGGRSFARSLHMVCAYGGFMLMSLHLGLHWSMILGIAAKHGKRSAQSGKWIFRGIGVLIACYGAYAFLKRDIGAYMLLQNKFVFFDFEEPLVFFMLDYMAVMGMFVFVGYYICMGLRLLQKKKE